MRDPAGTFESYVRILQLACAVDSRVFVTQLGTLEITAGTRYYMHRSCTRVHLYSRSRRSANNSYIPTWRAIPPRVFVARALMHTNDAFYGDTSVHVHPMNIGRSREIRHLSFHVAQDEKSILYPSHTAIMITEKKYAYLISSVISPLLLANLRNKMNKNCNMNKNCITCTHIYVL